LHRGAWAVGLAGASGMGCAARSPGAGGRAQPVLLGSHEHGECCGASESWCCGRDGGSHQPDLHCGRGSYPGCPLCSYRELFAGFWAAGGLRLRGILAGTPDPRPGGICRVRALSGETHGVGARRVRQVVHGECGRCFRSVDFTCQPDTPHLYRLIKRLSTRSCIRSVLEKHSVRRTSRLIRVRRLLCGSCWIPRSQLVKFDVTDCFSRLSAGIVTDAASLEKSC